MVYRLRLKDLGEKRQNLIIVPLTEEGFVKGGAIGEVIALNEKTGEVVCVKDDDTDYFIAKFCHCMLKSDYEKLSKDAIITLLPDSLDIK